MSDDGEDNTTSLEQRASGRAWPSLAGKTGRSAACGYHAPGRSADMAARLMVRSSGGGEGGKPTRQLPATCGLVKEPVAAHAVGNAVADMRSLPAGLGKTQRPVDRGAGGDRCQSDSPCGTRRLPPTRPGSSARGNGPRLLPETGFSPNDRSDWLTTGPFAAGAGAIVRPPCRQSMSSFTSSTSRRAPRGLTGYSLSVRSSRWSRRRRRGDPPRWRAIRNSTPTDLNSCSALRRKGRGTRYRPRSCASRTSAQA